MSKIKGTRFAQIPEWVLDAPISDRAIRLYGVLSRIVATERQDLPSRKRVAERMQCSVDSLDRAVKELVDLRALVVVPTKARPGSSECGPNDYELIFDQPSTGAEVAARVPTPSRSLAPTSPHGCGEGGRTGAAVRRDLGSSEDRTTDRTTETPLPPTSSTALALLQPSFPTQAPDDEVGHVFKEWIAATGRTAATSLSPDRRNRIKKALAAYPIADVLDAVRGWRYSPHHCGANDNGTVYNDIGLLLRNPEKIEFFRDLERRGPMQQRPEKAPVMDAAARYLQGLQMQA